jgi:hypothetical protein
VTTLPELVPGFEEKQAGVCGPTASRRPLSPHCRSQLLVALALADSARFSKRRRRWWKIYDRLLTIGSDRGQLASPANGWTTAFAQKEPSQQTPPDDRFRRGGVCVGVAAVVQAKRSCGPAIVRPLADRGKRLADLSSCSVGGWMIGAISPTNCQEELMAKELVDCLGRRRSPAAMSAFMSAARCAIGGCATRPTHRRWRRSSR